MGMNLAGMRVMMSSYVGELVTPVHPHPERIKRYRQRTLKRWRRAHPPYYRPNGSALFCGNFVLIHPADWPKLSAIVAQRPTASGCDQKT